MYFKMSKSMALRRGVDPQSFGPTGFQDRVNRRIDLRSNWRGREDSNLQALVLRGTTSLANWPFYQLRHCHMALGPGLEPGWGFHRRRVSSAVPYHFRTAKHGGVDRTRTCVGFLGRLRISSAARLPIPSLLHIE